MGTSKRRSTKPPPQLRSRTTRSRGKALPDPAENTQQLDEQLRTMGLYAASTLGDGNCLFRALSDQLYGTPSHHLRLRQDICEWIAAHKARYAPFVDDERGVDVHLQCMRQPATYGGHLELSAFAHMTRRDVKVIQPGLVYVIEWAAGGDPAEDAPESSAPSASTSVLDESTTNGREKRRAARERKRAAKEQPALPTPQVSEDDDPPSPIYVAYHDWEHFSSIRNLRGPHTGLPNIQETTAADAPSSPVSVAKKKPVSKVRVKPEPKVSVRKTRASKLAEEEAEPTAPQTPSQVPLPESRSVSPIPNHSLASLDLPHSYRSPKRTFDESSASSMHSESSQSAAKRAKSSSRQTFATPDDEVLPAEVSRSKEMQVDEADAEVDVDLDTPDLSVSGSSTESTSSLSSVPSPAATPPPTNPPPRLTQRQRKALGLPKPRPVGGTRSAGKIVIPGGKCRKSAPKPPVQATTGDDEDDAKSSAEWRSNGTGRVDVRGFRELKI